MALVKATFLNDSELSGIEWNIASLGVSPENVKERSRMLCERKTVRWV